MNSSIRSIKVLAGLITLSSANCAPVNSHGEEIRAKASSFAVIPVIDSIRPDSVKVPLGAVVATLVYGRGFSPGHPGANTVHFDRAVMRNVPASSDGRRIVFAIPNVIDSGGEAPPMGLLTGTYSMSVETTSGTSNQVTIRVYR